jgi:hypothetical protein
LMIMNCCRRQITPYSCSSCRFWCSAGRGSRSRTNV